MTALEMFEKLNYLKINSPDHLILFQFNDIDYHFQFTVGFNLSTKLYYASSENGALGIGLELHEAIIQQMKELGWIK